LTSFEKDPVFSEQGPDAAIQRTVAHDPGSLQIPLNAALRTFQDDKPALDFQNPALQNRLKTTNPLQLLPPGDPVNSSGTSPSTSTDDDSKP